MLGLCAIVLALVALSAVGSYWISWELHHKEKRPDFRTKLWNDVVQLLGRERPSETGSVTALPQQP
jgi:hypothetical protein